MTKSIGSLSAGGFLLGSDRQPLYHYEIDAVQGRHGRNERLRIRRNYPD